MIIRRAVAEDVDAIAACARAAYSKYIERIGREPAPMRADFATQVAKQQIEVMVVGHELVAFAVSYPLDDCYFLENIAVNPGCQGHGYGACMLNHIHAMAVGYPLVRLYTNEKMHENLAWYRRHGYIETARLVEDGFARVYMERRL
jgi:ribosomal protein S18 acetylase RimI-like enzyme